MTQINVWIETGESLTEREVKRAFERCGDRYFHQEVESFEVKAGEYPEEGIPGYLFFETDTDPDGMIHEVEWYLDGKLDDLHDLERKFVVEADEAPRFTEEEIEEMIPEEAAL